MCRDDKPAGRHGFARWRLNCQRGAVKTGSARGRRKGQAREQNRMRVLLIEDEADIADAVQRFLQGQGHAVDYAGDLADAEAALAVAEFDAVLLDL